LLAQHLINGGKAIHYKAYNNFTAGVTMPTILQRLNPDAKKDATTLAIERNPCVICRAFKIPICKGHAIGGGGGGGGAVAESRENKPGEPDEKKPLYFNIQETDNGTIQASAQRGGLIHVPSAVEKALLELIKTLDQLSISSDEKRNILTIQFRPGHPRQQELQELLSVIKDECHHFLKSRGYPVKKNTAVMGDSKLSIHISDKDLYHEFIIRLAGNIPSLLLKTKQQLLMKQNPEIEEHKEEKKHASPFDGMKGPRPKGVKKKSDNK
jgi:hypothetical protein